MTSLRPGLARLSQKSWRGALPADRAYDLWAPTYDRDDNPVKHLESRLLEKSLRGLRLKSPALLDFGCGTGRHWQLFLRSRPRRLLGCDVSRGMLKVLKARHPRAEIFLLKGKGPQKPVHFSFLAEASLDLVVCSLTLGYLGEIGSFLNECRRVLKPGGHLLVSDLHPDRVAEGARRDSRPRGTARDQTFSSWTQGVEASGRQTRFSSPAPAFGAGGCDGKALLPPGTRALPPLPFAAACLYARIAPQKN